MSDTPARPSLFIDANLSSPRAPPAFCRVQDYYAEGLYLVWNDVPDLQSSSRLRLAEVGDIVALSFKIALSGSDNLPFQVRARTVQLYPGGAAVQFLQQEFQLLDALGKLAGLLSSATARGKLGASTAVSRKVAEPEKLGQLKEFALAQTKPLLKTFLDATDERLFQAADAGKTNQEISEYFSGRASLRKQRDQLEKTWLEQIEQELSRLGQALESEEDEPGLDDKPLTATLSLVDKDEFEVYLAVSKVVTKLEQKLTQELFELNARCSYIAGDEIDSKNNPLGVRALVRKIAKTFDTDDFSLGVQKDILLALEQCLQQQAASHLQALNQFLKDKGVLPDLKYGEDDPAALRAAIRRPVVAAPRTAMPAQPPPDLAGTQAPAYPPDAGMAAAWPGGIPSSVPAYAPTLATGYAAGASPIMQGSYGPPPAGMAGGYNPMPPAPPPASFGAMPGAIGPGHPQFPSVGTIANGGLGAESTAYYALNNLMDLNRQLAAGGGGFAGAASAYAGGASAMPRGAYRGAPAGGASDYYTPAELLQALSQVQHQAPVIVQGAAPQWDYKDQLVSMLGAGGNVKQLSPRESDAMDMVGGMLSSLSEDFRIKTAARSQLQRLAIPLQKIAVRDPSFLSIEAHPARRILNQIAELQSVQDTGGEADPEVQRIIDLMVERLGANPDLSATNLLMEAAQLEEMLRKRQQNYTENVEEVVKQFEDQQAFLRDARKGASAAAMADSVALRKLPKEWQIWVQRAKRLRVGDAVMTKLASGKRQKQTLSWVGADYNPYVFVNAAGQKAATLTLQELAMQLRRGNITIVEDEELPAVERALRSVLFKVRDRFTRRALEDPRTGLPSRKQFLTYLEEARFTAVTSAIEHAVVCVDLYALTEVERKWGQRLGDDFLQQAKTLLTERLESKDVCANLGRDRFGLLLWEYDIARAAAVAQRVLDAVAEFRFSEPVKTVKLRPGVALIGVRADSPSPETLLESVEKACGEVLAGGGGELAIVGEDIESLQAAVAPAAEMDTEGTGTDLEPTLALERTQLLSPKDLLPATTIDWAAWVAEALQETHLPLFTQRIRRIGKDQNGDDFHELLLGFTDDEGQFKPLGDPARQSIEAETIHSLEKRMVAEALKWLETHADELAQLRTVAMKLSVHSLTKPKFIDYMLTQFTETGVPPGRIGFEIRRAALNTSPEAVQFMRTLREFGCRFILGDFGAGELADTNINELPIDFLSLESLFVAGAADAASDFAVIKSLNEVGHYMHKKTIATGMHTRELIDALERAGVDFVQGGAVEAPSRLAIN